MNHGLYTIFLGLRSRQNTLDAQANNLANASTTGFKAERLKYSTFEADKKGTGDRQLLVAGVSTASGVDFTPGSLQQTGRSLDVAISGDAFFQVQTQNGVRFTRAGNLTLNNVGQLVTQKGDLVVGDNGPITVPRNGDMSIDPQGKLISGGKQFDSLQLVRFNNPAAALVKEGDSMFAANGVEAPQLDASSKVVQGALEGSNTSSIGELAAMINNNREFESLQKSLTLLMNDVGRKISGEIGRT